MWVELIETNFNGPDEYRPKLLPPATASDLMSAEKRLGVSLPADLKDFLNETNGVSVTPDPDVPGWTQWLVVSAASLKIDETLPKPMLVIGNNDCGDVFGYCLESGGASSSVSIWAHDEEVFEDYGFLKDYILEEIDYNGLD